MGGYQFLHIECYSRVAGAGKAGGRTLRDVVAEAERDPAACPHIALPRPPVLLHGVMPSEAAELAEQRAERAKDGAGRKFRKDGLCLLGGVSSYPETWDKVESDPAAKSHWAAWEAATVAWLKDEYGSRLASVVRHEKDETHPHLHFYAIPELGDGNRLLLTDIHDGRRAAETAKGTGAKKSEQNNAYRMAMRAFQNRYWTAVGLNHGLTRLGPGRRRLTRGEWQAERAAATATAEALRRAEDATQREIHAAEAVERAKAAFAEAKAGATKAHAATEAAEMARQQAEADARSKARLILSKARAEGRRLITEAEVSAAPLRRLGGLLGALWSGFRGVEAKLNAVANTKVTAAQKTASEQVATAKKTLRSEARQAVADELARLRATADHAELNRQTAEARTIKAEAIAKTRAEELRQATTALTAERQARRGAEAERERFRGLWADADNSLLAMRARGHGRP